MPKHTHTEYGCKMSTNFPERKHFGILDKKNLPRRWGYCAHNFVIWEVFFLNNAKKKKSFENNPLNLK